MPAIKAEEIERLKEEKKLDRELSEDAKRSIQRARRQSPAGRTLEVIRERL